MELSPELRSELVKMRRNPDLFMVSAMTLCRFCGKGKTAYGLLHASSEVGTWCAVHGWTYFDSVKVPPSERLSPSELDDRKLAQQRKRKSDAGFETFCQEQNEL